MQLGGGPASGLFGELVTTKAATIDGTFQADVVGSFQPTIGDQFTVASYPSETGSFATINLPSSPAFTIQASVNAKNIVLVAQGTPTDLAVASIDLVAGYPERAGRPEYHGRVHGDRFLQRHAGFGLDGLGISLSTTTTLTKPPCSWAG